MVFPESRQLDAQSIDDVRNWQDSVPPWMLSALCALLPIGGAFLDHLLREDLQAFVVLLHLASVLGLTFLGGRLAGYATAAISTGLLALPGTSFRLDWLSTGGAAWDDLVIFALVAAAAIELLMATMSAFKRLREAHAASSALAAERQVLLDELQHRTGNNLQMIASLLLLQARRIDNAVASRSLDEAAHRVLAVANIQRRLQETEGGVTDLAPIIGALARNMAEANAIVIAYEAENDLGGALPGTAGPLTLIAQELIANAVEHGTRQGEPSRICVRLKRVGQHTALLSVSDEGPGLPEGLQDNASLGLTLVRALAVQIGAEFQLRNRSNGPGALATLLINLSKPSGSRSSS